MTSAVWLGDRSVLVTCADRRTRRAARLALGKGLPDAEVREGIRSVLVTSALPEPGLLDAVHGILVSGLAAAPADQPPGDEIRIGVRYDGIDLPGAATTLGLAVDQLVAAHSRQVWEVDVMGFAPGFGYLVPAGEWVVDWLRLPRRGHPRESVPRGSVAIAAGMSAVYPAAMPGGWHLLGVTDVKIFDALAADRPSLFVPGARVQFHSVDR